MWRSFLDVPRTGKMNTRHVLDIVLETLHVPLTIKSSKPPRKLSTWANKDLWDFTYVTAHPLLWYWMNSCSLPPHVLLGFICPYWWVRMEWNCFLTDVPVSQLTLKNWKRNLATFLVVAPSLILLGRVINENRVPWCVYYFHNESILCIISFRITLYMQVLT